MKRKWWKPEERRLSWKDLEKSLPFDLAEQLRAKRLKMLRERPPLVGQEFIELWNKCVREMR